MRNSKVRRRIAAGKLSLRIRDLRNLGPRSETMLARVGIHSVDALRATGGLRAFLALRRAGVTKSTNALWALVGALEPWPEGRHWRDVATGDERLALLLAVEGRDRARREVLAAAQVRQEGRQPAHAAESRGGKARRTSARRLGRGEARRNAADEAWAPGLPFGKSKT
jgi:DNA transformation protein and related proteins